MWTSSSSSSDSRLFLSVLWDDDKDGYSNSTETVKLVCAEGLNHAVTMYSGSLYASSSTTVFRWPYSSTPRAMRTPITTPGEVVVKNIPTLPSGGGHKTRTLLFLQDQLYVTCGSGGNIDRDPERAAIHVFNMKKKLPSGGFDWSDDGKVFAIGMRNEVGLRADSTGEQVTIHCLRLLCSFFLLFLFLYFIILL